MKKKKKQNSRKKQIIYNCKLKLRHWAHVDFNELKPGAKKSKEREEFDSKQKEDRETMMMMRSEGRQGRAAAQPDFGGGGGGSARISRPDSSPSRQPCESAGLARPLEGGGGGEAPGGCGA